MTLDPRETDMAVHHRLVHELIEHGHAPNNVTLARILSLDLAALERSFRRLEASHSLVLHPHECSPWIVHPFSTSPTHTWVACEGRGWWAPCLWCALGISVLAGGRVVIHTCIGGEADPIALVVNEGVPDPECTLVAHFPEPPRLAWNNVQHFCARLLPFRSAGEIASWTERHGFPSGETVPVPQLALLARLWYGRHAQPDWRKATHAEAAAIFRSAGLTGGFWQLEDQAGAF